MIQQISKIARLKIGRLTKNTSVDKPMESGSYKESIEHL